MEHPLGKQRRDLRQKALVERMKGKGHGKVHQVAKGQYVELAREGEDPIWTVLGEFGTEPASEEIQEYILNKNPEAVISEAPGPLHNLIPEPDRDVNNVTHWVEDFSREHYLDMLFADGGDANSLDNLVFG